MPRPPDAARSHASRRASSSATRAATSCTATRWPRATSPPATARRSSRRPSPSCSRRPPDASTGWRRAAPSTCSARPGAPSSSRRSDCSTTGGAPLGGHRRHRRRHRAPAARGRAPRLRRQHQPRAEDAVGALGLLAETLARRGRPAVARRLAERMLDEAFRVGRTIDDLLELRRIEADERPAASRCPVHLVVAEAVDRIRPAAEQRGHRRRGRRARRPPRRRSATAASSCRPSTTCSTTP